MLLDKKEKEKEKPGWCIWLRLGLDYLLRSHRDLTGTANHNQVRIHVHRRWGLVLFVLLSGDK